MNSAFTPLRLILTLVALLFTSTTGSASAADNQGESVGFVIVPDNVPATDVAAAMEQVLRGRAWGIKSKSEDTVVGYLKHRSNEATVTLTHSGKKIDLHCVGWAINKKTGERKKPELPHGWLKNLQSDLTKLLNRLTTSS
jgi:hypothetical protein